VESLHQGLRDTAQCSRAKRINFQINFLQAVLKMSRGPPEQGARQQESAVYKGVQEHFELPRNTAMASAVVFKTAS